MNKTMDRELAGQLILDFNEEPLPELIPRDTELVLPKTKKAISIIGPRRSGKTYFLFDCMKRMDNIDRDQMLYLNLEDDRLLPFDLASLDLFMQVYDEMFPKNQKRRLHLFLDEIQNVPGWESFVRRVMDSRDVQVYLSGSSSKLLSKEISTSMRGRSISHLVCPFSFREFLRARDFQISKNYSSAQKATLLHHLSEYVEYGGFPEVMLEDNENIKIKTLKEYVEVLLVRDVIERHSIKNFKVLRTLFNSMINSFAKEFSIHMIYRSLKSQGIRLSKNTLYEYMGHLEDAFAVIALRRFSYSLREIDQSLPKIYMIDSGLTSLLPTRFSQNIGRAMENTVAIELFKQGSDNPKLGHYYWKNMTGEVDFVIKDGTRIRELIQVCHDLSDLKTRERETGSLLKADRELEAEKLTILTWDERSSVELGGRIIEIMPLWKWLLGA